MEFFDFRLRAGPQWQRLNVNGNVGKDIDKTREIEFFLKFLNSLLECDVTVRFIHPSISHFTVVVVANALACNNRGDGFTPNFGGISKI